MNILQLAHGLFIGQLVATADWVITLLTEYNKNMLLKIDTFFVPGGANNRLGWGRDLPSKTNYINRVAKCLLLYTYDSHPFFTETSKKQMETTHVDTTEQMHKLSGSNMPFSALFLQHMESVIQSQLLHLFLF